MSTYLDHIAKTSSPMVWGYDDCALWVADFVCLETGYDPAIAIRGKYNCLKSALKLYRKAGGPGGVLKQAGYRKIDPNQAITLDIGFVRLHDQPMLVSAIYKGGKWYARGQIGVTVYDTKFIEEAYTCRPQ